MAVLFVPYVPTVTISALLHQKIAKVIIIERPRKNFDLSMKAKSSLFPAFKCLELVTFEATIASKQVRTVTFL